MLSTLTPDPDDPEACLARYVAEQERYMRERLEDELYEWLEEESPMETFKTDDIDDGLFAVFPTVLLRVQGNDVSIGLWWGAWCVHFGWWRWKKR